MLHLVKAQILHCSEVQEGKKFQYWRGSRKLSLGGRARMTAFARDRKTLKVFDAEGNTSAGGEIRELGFAGGSIPSWKHLCQRNKSNYPKY